ncbi:MAG: helix-turn-helix transcriptional regulator [Planctomycetota bacterium]|jgi:DNA-binding transcriptional ArsR family regulator
MAAKKAIKKSVGIRKKKATPGKTSPARTATDASAGSRAASSTRWTFLTNHTHVLVLLDTDEPPILRDVATRVGITERAVQRIIQDLEEGGFIERERVGRRNRYRVLRDQELRHPIESHRTIGDLLKLVTRRS